MATTEPSGQLMKWMLAEEEGGAKPVVTEELTAAMGTVPEKIGGAGTLLGALN